MDMKLKKRLPALVLGLILIMTSLAIPVLAENNDPDAPFYKYPETVNLTAGVPVYDGVKRLPEGDTLENNRYTRYFEEHSNIHITNKFEAQNGDAYSQKVQLAAASDDLPDFMVVDKRDYSLFKQMVEFGQVADLTEAYNKYVNPEIRAKIESGDGSALKQVTFDGKIMAIPSPTFQYDTMPLLWIRQDWLDELGLQPPQTVEDLEAIAKAFIAKGFGGKSIMGLTADKYYDEAFAQIFAAYNAFPTQWYLDGSGELTFGAITPQAKEGLAKLAQMYKDGLIDPEFASRESSTEVVADNRVGMYFCPWWAPWGALLDSTKNDPTANWQAYTLPLSAEGKFSFAAPDPNNCYLVVSSNCQNIDAVMRYFNVSTDLNAVINEALYKDIKGLDEPYRLSAVSMVFDYVDCIPRKNILYNAILEGKETIGGPTDINPVETQYNIDCINAEAKTPRGDIDAWAQAAAYLIGAKPLVNNDKIVSVPGAYYGSTAIMDAKWANLKQLKDQVYLGIITGNLPIDAFDQFVSDWKTQGGDEITAEIKAIID
jgi:putative aldouronate transport system substrate-binding protein